MAPFCNGFTLQWFHFARVQRYIVMIVYLLKKLFVNIL